MSTSTTWRLSSFSATRCATDAPTFPAPTTVIFCIGVLFGCWMVAVASGLRGPSTPGGLRPLPVDAHAELPDSLVQHDADGRGQVQATDSRPHGDADHPFRVLDQDPLREAVGLVAEY